MPLKPIPDHGLELSVGEYHKLKAFQGGGHYWDHHHQQTIRECLGEFLPRVEETGGGALFQHFVHNREAAAHSKPVAAGGDRVPKGELQRLHRALETLKRKAADPNTDKDARRIIESFTLPDPAKDPELYRLHGPPWKRRLLVLWGCEREVGSSVAPAAALNRVPVEPTSTTWLRRWPWLLGLLLLLLALLLLADTIRENRRRELPPAPPVSPAAAAPTPVGTAPGALPSPTPGPNAVPPGGASPPAVPSAGSAVPLPPDGASPGVDTRGGRSPGGGSPGNLLGADPAASPSVNPAISRSPVPPGLASGAASPREAVPGGSPALSTTSGTPPAAGVPRPGPASVPPPGASPSPSRPPAPPTSPAGTSASPPATTRVPDSPPPSTLPPGGTLPPSSLAAPTPTGSPGVSPGPDAPVLPPTVSISARSSPAPKGGKVDVRLSATAAGADGKAAPLTITGWRIDGNPPSDAARRGAEPGEMSLNLPEGPHRVRVTGTSNGTPVETEVEMDVRIRSQSDVRVKPAAPR